MCWSNITPKVDSGGNALLIEQEHLLNTSDIAMLGTTATSVICPGLFFSPNRYSLMCHKEVEWGKDDGEVGKYV